jgi:hypothetical protein
MGQQWVNRDIRTFAQYITPKYANHTVSNILIALERLRYLSRQTDRPNRVSIDAQEVLDWLDQITSDYENPASQLVHLENPMQLFEQWSEVEQFMLPETLLSMESETHTTAAEPENLNDSLADLRMDAMPDNTSMSSQESAGARTSSPISVYSAASPALLAASPRQEGKAVQPIGHGRPGGHKKSASNVSNISMDQKKEKLVPKSLQPFFNHLLWSINQGGCDFAETRESYILVTNDGLKQNIGQRFGIRCKRLEQLRDIIAREERDMRNRDQLLKKEIMTPRKEVSTPTLAQTDGAAGAKDTQNDDDDDDEIVFKRPPPKAPQAMNGNSKFVVDPNQFGVRDTPPHKVMPEQYRYTRGGRPAFQRGGRGGSSPASNRVNGHSSSPRNITPVAPRQVPVAPIDITKPIDPDSYARPVNAKGMARGGRRRLWEPT